MKACRTCGIEKTVDSFWRAATNTDGLCSDCKTCMSERQKRNRSSMRHRCKTVYRITLEEYDRRLAESGGICAICKSETDLHLDHDEETGELRDFLCGKCNRGIGMFDHAPALLIAAQDYLVRHRELLVPQQVCSEEVGRRTRGVPADPHLHRLVEAGNRG